MELSQLISPIHAKSLTGAVDGVEITQLTCDSRQVTEGAMFVAVRGVAVDAHRFIPDTIARGARAIVCEQLPETIHPDVSYIQVEDSNIALAHLASQWFGNPSRRLRLVGVTGTNGKTTIATLLYQLFRNLGHKAGLLSTVKNIIDTREVPATQTTPDHLTLNRLLAEMVDAGCEYAFIEVSSHACAQHRIDGLTFAGGIFTNLTQDHLDYHKTMDEYLRAKKSFFDALPPEAFALTNLDDKNGRVMLQNCNARQATYSLRQIADFKTRLLEERLDGMSLLVDGKEVEVLLTGRFNASNLTAIYGAAVLLGVNRADALLALSTLHPADGRFQTLQLPNGATAIVDYAHTPDALRNVLDTIIDLVGTSKRKIITVCGCGGNRDSAKRPIMARIAAERSGQLILTSDNPRNEDPDEILRQMQVGLDDEQARNALVITDRRQAIRTARTLAQPGDIILVAGKGHETYQEINGVKHHFDDREQLLEP